MPTKRRTLDRPRRQTYTAQIIGLFRELEAVPARSRNSAEFKAGNVSLCRRWAWGASIGFPCAAFCPGHGSRATRPGPPPGMTGSACAGHATPSSAKKQAMQPPFPHTLLSLSDAQISIIMAATRPLQAGDRPQFLEEIAGRLAGLNEIGDGTVARICRDLQRAYLVPQDLRGRMIIRAARWQSIASGCGDVVLGLCTDRAKS
jgi:hypothetical protein